MKVSREEINARGEVTEVEQAEINRRISDGEPVYDEDREGFEPPKKEPEKKEPEGKDPEEGKDTTKEPENKDKKEPEQDQSFDESEFQKISDDEKELMITALKDNLDKTEDESEKQALQAKIARMEELAKAENKEETEEDIIEEYAKEHKVSVEEAKKVVESEKSIAEKYQNNPLKLARAYRSTQSEYDKIKAENAKLKEATEKALEMAEKAKIENVLSGNFRIEDILSEKDGRKYDRDHIIAAYREAYPEIAEDQDDDVVYNLAKKEFITEMRALQKTQKVKIASQASEVRTSAIAGLSEDMKPYKKEVEDILKVIPDEHIVDKSFNLDVIKMQVKGSHFDEAVKAAELRGYKRGMENSKILGAKSVTLPPKGTSKATGSTSKDFGLSSSEKKQAELNYAEDNISTEKRYALHAYSLGKITREEAEQVN